MQVFLRTTGIWPNERRAGFTLVTVLIILALLAVVAVGFLSSMTAERTTAAAYGTKIRAEQMAQAGVDNAVAILKQCFKDFPDSCTVWDPKQSTNIADTGAASSTYNGGTSLYYRALQAAPVDTDDNRPPMLTEGAANADKRQIYVLPLTSGVIGGIGQPEATKTSALPTFNTNEPDLTKQNFININTPRFQYDSEGWIGSPPGHADVDVNNKPAPTPVRASWVEMKDANGTVNGRYAYWVEDESFKANINYADLGDPTNTANTHQRRDNSINPPVTDALGFINPRDVDMSGPFKVIDENGSSVTGNPAPNANESVNGQAIVSVRKAYPGSLFPEKLAYKHAVLVDAAIGSATAPAPATIADKLRFLTTTTSGGLNMSRHGSQRVNLNATIPTNTDPSATSIVQSQVDQLVQTMRFHAPNFGQRFYRKSAAQTSAALNALDVGSDDVGDHSLIYLYKEAANIRDYIDVDNVPTVVLGTGKVPTAAKPLIAFDAPPWAIGKDAAPFIQEAAINFRGDVTSGKYTLVVDYYIELWNMSTRDVKASDLGKSPFIRVASPAAWYGTLANLSDTNFLNPVPLVPDDGGPSPSTSRSDATHPRDFDIDLTGVTFPAGQVTVLTTDTKANHAAASKYQGRDYNEIITNTEALKHVVECKWVLPGKSVYHGSMPLSNSSATAVTTDTIRVKFEDSATTDYQTDLVFGNENGYIDAIVTIPMSYTGGTTGFRFPDTKAPYAPLGGYLRGNWTNTGASDGLGPSAVGDPRCNNEQLAYYKTEGTASEATRYKNYLQQAAHSPVPSHPYVPAPSGILPTLGLPNYMSVRENRTGNPWSDSPPHYATPDANPTATELVMTAEKAPSVIGNGALNSIGQLGDVFDAARTLNSASAIDSCRGGGRTLKIGQHDDRWDGDQLSASRSWTSWRLLDFFSIADHADQPRMVDGYGIEQPGVININGVARDNGAALKAALMGFLYQPKPVGDAALDPSATPSANVPQVQKLVDAMVTRITTPLKDPETQAINLGGVTQTGAGPFWERGELSELPVFGRTHSTTPARDYANLDLTGIDLSSKVYDRGREELFRRIAEMITTRGDTFTVYAVGQAITQKSSTAAKIYSSTQRLKVTFRLIAKASPSAINGISPDFHPGTDSSGKTVAFDASAGPLLDQRLKTRFDKPNHYDIQVIESSAGL